MVNLQIASGIEIKYIPKKGYGVFATENFPAGHLIEECRVIKVYNFTNDEWKKHNEVLKTYVFGFPAKTKIKTAAVIPLGYGCIYNHSITPNATWKNHPLPNVSAFQFISLREIKAGEEITTSYGGADYWNNNQAGVFML